MPEPASIDSTLRALAHPFRARFHLRGRDAATVELRGMDSVREHAAELLAKRLAPTAPHKDGKQTPYRGHPVFVAQHATATCCRGCLAKWHGIEAGRSLSAEEQAHAVAAIARWLDAQSDGISPPRTSRAARPGRG